MNGIKACMHFNAPLWQWEDTYKHTDTYFYLHDLLSIKWMQRLYSHIGKDYILGNLQTFFLIDIINMIQVIM